MRRDAGFVLVNALLIVAALAAVAAMLLARSEAARLRLDLATEAAQANLYLDGFEVLAAGILDRDRGAGAIDHAGETWARASYDVPVDRGRVAGRIADQQGLFNLNMLAGGDDPAAQAAFLRLAGAIGLPAAPAGAVIAHLRGVDGPALAVYARQPVPMHPRGGSLTAIEQLRQVPGLGEAGFLRLRAYVTALPSLPGLNVNTAPAEVLAALLPAAAAPAVPALVSHRRDTPFVSVEDFLSVLAAVGAADLAEVNPDRFTVESRWFMVDSAANLGTVAVARRSLVERVEPGARARVQYRLRMPR